MSALINDRKQLPSDSTAEARSAKIEHYGLLEEGNRDVFQDLTLLASTICKAPVALVTLLEGSHQYFKAITGIELDTMPIEHSFCTHALEHPDEVMVVEDARLDKRFDANPYVHDDPGVLSYAGSPLVTEDGVPLGTICVLDTKARSFTEDQKEALRIIGRQVMDQIVLQRRVVELERSKYVLESLNRQLDQFAYIISHDLKAPIRHQTSFARMIVEDFGDTLDEEILMFLGKITKAGEEAQTIITDLNDYLHTVQTAFGERHPVSLKAMIDEIIRLADPPPTVNITAKVETLEFIDSNATALRHILLNLVANAIKFNDRSDGQIAISASLTNDTIIISVKDNGPGLSSSDQAHIFQLFGRGTQSVNKPGKGMGLAIATKLAQNLGGSIEVESVEGEGADFLVRLPRR